MQEQKSFDYVEEATLTLSNQFHGELVSREKFMITLVNAITALENLDAVKKALFYGRDHESLRPRSSGQISSHSVVSDIIGTNDPTEALSKFERECLIHGIIGIATEAGELLEALLTAIIEEQALDLVNLKEEVGDAKWYMAILAKTAGFAWGDDEKVNIRKLRQRFPNAFTEYDAVNRNLVKERVILEHHIGGKVTERVSTYRDPETRCPHCGAYAGQTHGKDCPEKPVDENSISGADD